MILSPASWHDLKYPGVSPTLNLCQRLIAGELLDGQATAPMRPPQHSCSTCFCATERKFEARSYAPTDSRASQTVVRDNPQIYDEQPARSENAWEIALECDSAASTPGKRSAQLLEHGHEVGAESPRSTITCDAARLPRRAGRDRVVFHKSQAVGRKACPLFVSPPFARCQKWKG